MTDRVACPNRSTACKGPSCLQKQGLASFALLVALLSLLPTVAFAAPNHRERIGRKARHAKEVSRTRPEQAPETSVALRPAGGGLAHSVGSGRAYGAHGAGEPGQHHLNVGHLAVAHQPLSDRVSWSDKDWLDSHAARVAGKNQELHCDLCAASASQAADAAPGERTIGPQIDVRAWTNRLTTLRLDDATVKVTGLNPFGVQIRKPF